MMSKSGEEIKFKTFLSLSKKKKKIWQQIIKWLSLSLPPSLSKQIYNILLPASVPFGPCSLIVMLFHMYT
jgi:hypothetical protein